jgi:hypothetical protein
MMNAQENKMADRAKVKAKLEAIAKTQGGTVTPVGDELHLAIPEGEGMTIILRFWDSRDTPMCTTNYKAKGKEFTFDRYGVDDSFYFETITKLPQQVQEQRERVKASQARLALTESFDMGPIRLMLSPEALAAIVTKLKEGKTHTYHPSGFGTGYYFSTNPKVRMRFDTAKASAQLEKLVGAKVYVSQFDAD